MLDWLHDSHQQFYLTKIRNAIDQDATRQAY